MGLADDHRERQRLAVAHALRYYEKDDNMCMCEICTKRRDRIIDAVENPDSILGDS